MRALGLIGVLALAGCSGLHTGYVRADRLTFEAVGKEYRGYVEADADLTTAERERRLRTLASWEARVRAAEEALSE